MGRKCKILLILLYNCKKEIQSQTYSYSGKRFSLIKFSKFSCTHDYQKSSNSTGIVGASEKAYFSFRKS